MIHEVSDSIQKYVQRMIERHWCVHKVDVLRIMTDYAYLHVLEVEIYLEESKSNHAYFYKQYKALSTVYDFHE